MNATEAGQLVALMALYDNRKASDPDIVAWLKVVGDLPYGDCESAVVAHYQDTRERIMPADIRNRVKAMRRDRIDRAIPAAPPAEVADTPGRYKAALDAAIRRIANGRSMHRAIGGPVRDAEPPAEFTEARAGMGTALKRDGSLSPQEVARRQAAESRAARGDRDDPPAKDPAA